MFEEKLDIIYRKIAQKTVDMIPVEWNEIHLEGEVLDGGGGVYFYYDTPDDKGNYLYSNNIPNIYNIDKKMYRKLLRELFFLVEELQSTFISNGQEKWFSYIMHLHANGQFQLEYNYINWYEGDFDTNDMIDYFKYKYLGVAPDDINKIKMMEEYASNQK